MNNLRIGGFTPFSTVDYPDMLVSVIFLQGCNWRCYYCHNKSLLPNTKSGCLEFDTILEFIKTRINLIDGVVFSGGEPLIQSGLLDAIKEIKQLGLLVGLHTSGSCPNRLLEVLGLVDWVCLDLKTRLEEHSNVTNVKNSGIDAFRSAEILRQSSVKYMIKFSKGEIYDRK